jgi:hypothetical protein
MILNFTKMILTLAMSPTPKSGFASLIFPLCSFENQKNPDKALFGAFGSFGRFVFLALNSHNKTF